jgi:hypothetical protein
MKTTPAGDVPMRFFYVDDSGSVDTGFIVYSWIEVTPAAWRPGLRTWLDLRKDLYARYQVPPARELHATKFANGRDNISTNAAVNQSKATLRRVMTDALATIGGPGGVAVGTAYRRTSTKGPDYARERKKVYGELIAHLEGRLAREGGYGLVFMDGNGTDPTYQRVHRELKLAERRIIEDPLFQGAHLSQWVQMADLVAYSSYQALLKHPKKQFAWTWYDTYLRRADVNGKPLEL